MENGGRNVPDFADVVFEHAARFPIKMGSVRLGVKGRKQLTPRVPDSPSARADVRQLFCAGG